MLVKNLSFLLVALIASKKNSTFYRCLSDCFIVVVVPEGDRSSREQFNKSPRISTQQQKGDLYPPPHHKITFVLFSGFMVKDIGCCCSPVDIKRQCQEINAQIKKVPDHRQVEHRWQRFPTRMRIFHFLNYNLKVQLKEMLHLQFFINRTHLGQ